MDDQIPAGFYPDQRDGIAFGKGRVSGPRSSEGDDSGVWEGGEQIGQLMSHENGNGSAFTVPGEIKMAGVKGQKRGDLVSHRLQQAVNGRKKSFVDMAAAF